MRRIMERGWPPLVALAAASLVTPALAGSSPMEWVSYGANGLALGLSIMGGIMAVVFAAVFWLPRRFAFAILAVLIVTAIAPAAFAQAVASDTQLPIAWGDMANGAFKFAVEAILPVLSVALSALAARLTWWVPMVFTTARIDRALRTGADYAINAVAGATHDKVITVDVGYAVIKVALERILGSTPGWLIKAMGGPKGITERLFRVFKFDERVTDKNTLQKVIDDLPTFPFVRDAA